MNEPGNKAEDLKGRAKEAAGDLTDDEELQREGQTDQASSTVKEKVDEAKEKVQDTVDDVKDKVQDRLNR